MGAAHGATHYTHWFVPMTGSTAEKHDSFLTPTSDGQTISGSPAGTCSRASPTRPVPVGRPARDLRGRGYTGWDVRTRIDDS